MALCSSQSGLSQGVLSLLKSLSLRPLPCAEPAFPPHCLPFRGATPVKPSVAPALPGKKPGGYGLNLAAGYILSCRLVLSMD